MMKFVKYWYLLTQPETSKHDEPSSKPSKKQAKKLLYFLDTIFVLTSLLRYNFKKIHLDFYFQTFPVHVSYANSYIFLARYLLNLIKIYIHLGSNHLVSLFANELTFYLVKVSSCISYELTFIK